MPKSEWKTTDQAVSLGWEEHFGDIIDKDGLVGPPPAIDANGDGLVDDTNQSKLFYEQRGIPIQEKNGQLKGNYKNKKLGYEVIKAKTINSGFYVLLKGNGKKNKGKFMQWNVDFDGVITNSTDWKWGDDAVYDGWENLFGDIIQVDGQIGQPPSEDNNGDGLVDGIKAPRIFDSGSAISIKTKSGKIMGDSNKKNPGYNVIKAVSTDEGYSILLNRQDSKNKDQFYQWNTDDKGIIQKVSGWKSAADASDWEKHFGDIIQPDGIIGRKVEPSRPSILDQNNDGLVDGTKQSQIFDDSTGLPITDRGGRPKSNWNNRKWGYNILKAVPNDEGFDLLLKGSGKKNRGRFLMWSTDESGMITGKTGWKVRPFALRNEWESIFGDIIQPNGVIN